MQDVTASRATQFPVEIYVNCMTIFHYPQAVWMWRNIISFTVHRPLNRNQKWKTGRIMVMKFNLSIDPKMASLLINQNLPIYQFYVAFNYFPGVGITFRLWAFTSRVWAFTSGLWAFTSRLWAFTSQLWAFTSRVWAHFSYRVIPSISQGGSKCPS